MILVEQDEWVIKINTRKYMEEQNGEVHTEAYVVAVRKSDGKEIEHRIFDGLLDAIERCDE